MMKTPRTASLLSRLLCASLALIASQGASAAQSESLAATLTPTEPGAEAVLLRSIRARPGVLSAELLFSDSERRALVALGDPLLSGSIRLKLSSQPALSELRAWARSTSAPARIDEDAIAIPQSALAQAEDPLEAEQWGLHNRGAGQGIYLDDVTTLTIPGISGEDIDAPADEPTEKPVIVAVLDTGLDVGHPDLKSRVLRHEGECKALADYQACVKKESRAACDAKFAKIDSDGNGYPMDCSGWNVTAAKNDVTGIQGDSDTHDDVGHGTHVAGVIAAALNGVGVRGVAQNALILPVKVIQTAPNSPIRPQSADPTTPGADPAPLPSPGEANLRWSQGFADTIARGMLYAIRSGAQVINLSLAWPSAVDSSVMRRMVALAQAHGAIIVAAAGNDSTDSRVMPCLYAGVICVGAHGPDGAFAHYSNYGPFVDLLAPGTRILSSWPSKIGSSYYTKVDGYELKSGTSMASPFVAGAVARMLGRGMTPAEIYARLLVGARPTRDSSLRPDSITAKYSRSGNLDLARAISASPEPLILPDSKSALQALWKRSAASLDLRLSLRNFWERAQSVSIRARVLSFDSVPKLTPAQGDDDSVGISLSASSWNFGPWDSSQKQELTLPLRITGRDPQARFSIEFAVSADGRPERRFRVPVELAVEVGPGSQDPGMRSYPIQSVAGRPLDPDASIRTVKTLVPGASQEFIAVERASVDELRLTLFVPDGAGFTARASANIAAKNAEFTQIQKLDVRVPGKDEYVVLLRLPGPTGSARPIFRFVTLDSSLKTVSSFDYDNKTTIVSERFQWARVDGQRVPAWVSLGLTPKLDKPAYDPWNPDWQDEPANRLYILAPEGLRAIDAPDDMIFVQTLAPAKDDLTRGAVPVLLAHGDDYRKTYFVARLFGRKLEEAKPVAMEESRMLLGLPSLSDSVSIGASATIDPSTIFAGPSHGGSIRSTRLSAEASPRATHTEVSPTLNTDSVMRVIGEFDDGQDSIGSFCESHYDFVYRDARSGQSVSTTLSRFSFIPAFIFGRSMAPVVARRESALVPALLVPADFGNPDGLEVLLPDRDLHTGALVRVSRPARLRLQAAPGCQLLGLPLRAGTSSESAAMFFCGDQFIRVPFAE